MVIKLKAISGREITVDKPIELAFTQSLGVACDSLWAYFYSSEPVEEIISATATENDKLIFFGYCDCQKTVVEDNRFKIYFYARSSASLLVDNKAHPFTYDNPTANGLAYSNSKRFGFVSELPDIKSDSQYEVSAGTSCYGAISQFVLLLTGKNIAVTPDNKIVALTESRNVISLDSYKILSFSHTVNRSSLLSQINYKKNLSQSGYTVHTKSQLSEEIGIKREQYVNLSSLPQWQRENMILQKLRDSYENYRVIDVAVSGYADVPLLQRFSCGYGNMNYGEYLLTERKYICDKNGKRTVLVLKKSVDIKEITYVD